MVACSFCKPGKYKDRSNGTACDPCEMGKASSQDGALFCSSCPAGKHMNTLQTDWYA